MGFLPEVLRIMAAPVAGLAGAATGGAATPFVLAGMNGAANAMDKEDEPGTPKAEREMKKKRREDWIKFALKRAEQKRDKLKKYPKESWPAMGKAISASNGADLRAVIRGDIFETEERIAGDQEVNLLAEAVSARVSAKL